VTVRDSPIAVSDNDNYTSNPEGSDWRGTAYKSRKVRKSSSRPTISFQSLAILSILEIEPLVRVLWVAPIQVQVLTER
jgi:hypothetical protein